MKIREKITDAFYSDETKQSLLILIRQWQMLLILMREGQMLFILASCQQTDDSKAD
jgi:hypothetical protein